MKIILRCQFRFRKKTHDRFPTLNEYIDCERGSTIAAAAMKKEMHRAGKRTMPITTDRIG